MGLFDDTASIISRKSHHSSRHGHSSSKDKRHSRHSVYSISSRKSNKSHSRSRSRSRSVGAKSTAASFFGLGDDHRDKRRYSRHNSSRASFFGLPNVSTRSFFGVGGDKHRASTSSYRRSPRASFVTRAYHKLKKLLRDLVYYAKRNPIKVFTLIVVPLITGGALTALLARFGLRLPPSIERMLGMGARAMSGDAVGLVGEAVRMASGMRGGEYEGARSVRVERGRDGELQWERKSSSWDDYGLGGGWGGGMMKMARGFFD